MSFLAKIPEQAIQSVREQASIVEVVSHYIPLHKKGRNYVAVCPFHDDHNPSMSISQDKQIFRCFVCGAAGNVFSFVSRFENITFIEAVQKVAEIANIPFTYEVKNQVKEIPKEKRRLYDVIRETMRFSNYELMTDHQSEAYKYLQNRGINDSLIEKFMIGYGVTDNKLYSFLKAKKYTIEEMVEANVVRVNEHGTFDVFHDRIMLPIHDADGNAVGFSARALFNQDVAKYINTSETPIYTKGNLLFNYHRAKVDAKRLKRVLIVEGAMDVLALEKAEITNGVATLGTACTKEQIQLLRYLHATLVIFYDGDKAGLDATYKFGLMAQERNIPFEIVNNKHGLDPDEIIMKYSIQELQETCKQTKSWIQFLFEYLPSKYNLNNYSEKKAFAKIMNDHIMTLEDTFEKESYARELYALTGFNALPMATKQTQTTITSRGQQAQNHAMIRPRPGLKNAQYQIIALMLLSKVASDTYRQILGFLPNDTYNSLGLYIIDYYRKYDTIKIADLFDYIQEDAVKQSLLEIAEWDLAPSNYQEEIMIEAIEKIKEGLIREQINMLLEQSNQISDPKEKARIGNQIIKLRRQKGE